ncbi:hypothetical protein C3F09_08645 [candidate division GN15 bacterium]|uniref:Glycosyltransferase family 1 protein n=1 Tax=candidate division GN15 bacterium TaxID=2072418 RepID=A0A855X4H5_9BACT|nr:MAG: hypothetical protein C3F09_08645 [candidate division GN15 bacterium]
MSNNGQSVSESRIRVAIGADLLDGERCGMQLALRDMLAGFARAGFSRDMHLVHTKPFQDRTFDSFQDLPVSRRMTTGGGVYWSQLAVPRAIRRLPVDVLWWPCQILPPIRCHVPRVISVWDMAPLNYEDENWSRLSVTVKYRWILASALKEAAHVICHSQAIADEVRRRYGLPTARVSVVYPGLSEPFRRATQHRTPIDPEGHILYVGTCASRKNVRLLLDAYKLLLETGIRNRLALVIGGPKKAIAALLTHAREIGIGDDRLLLPDPHGIDELIEVYRQAAVFAFPSLYEGFGLPLIEASALGLPVVGLRRSTIPEVLAGTGVLVEEAQPIQFAQGITAGLAMMRERGTAISEAARTRAAQFDWDESVRSISSILRRAAAGDVS